MDLLELLREAYARDLLDIEELERFVGEVVAGRPVGLPLEVQALRRELAPAGPPTLANVHAILREAYTEGPIAAEAGMWADMEQRQKQMARQFLAQKRQMRQLADHAAAVEAIKRG
jgi:hypothetical protein